MPCSSSALNPHLCAGPEDASQDLRQTDNHRQIHLATRRRLFSDPASVQDSSTAPCRSRNGGDDTAVSSVLPAARECRPVKPIPKTAATPIVEVARKAKRQYANRLIWLRGDIIRTAGRKTRSRRGFRTC